VGGNSDLVYRYISYVCGFRPCGVRIDSMRWVQIELWLKLVATLVLSSKLTFGEGKCPKREKVDDDVSEACKRWSRRDFAVWG
jgi:hypothetical protein